MTVLMTLPTLSTNRTLPSLPRMISSASTSPYVVNVRHVEMCALLFVGFVEFATYAGATTPSCQTAFAEYVTPGFGSNQLIVYDIN